MTTQTKDRTNDAAQRLDQSVEKSAHQQRDQLNDHLQRDLVDKRAIEQRDLGATHRMLDRALEDQLGNDVNADRAVARPVLDRFEQTQRRQQDDAHRLEREVTERLRDVLAKDAEVGVQDEQLNRERAEVSRQAFRDTKQITDVINAALSRDTSRMADALTANTTREQRERQLDGVLRRQQEDVGRQQAQIRQLKAELDVALRVDAAARDRLRSEVDGALHLDRDRFRLSDDAVLRIAAKARPNEQLSTEQRRAAEGHVKGQLFEELFAVIGQQKAAELNKTRGPDEQVEFIQGHRIRDEHNQQLSDGLIASRDRDDRLRIDEAFEVKAGADAARDLTRRIREVTASDAEIQAYAQDIARDTVFGEQAIDETLEQYAQRQQIALRDASAQQLADLEEARKQAVTDLLSRRTQMENGQPDELIERLHESTDRATRVLIDHREEALAVNQGRTHVTPVTPDGIRLSLDPVQVGVRSRQLADAAHRILEELDKLR